MISVVIFDDNSERLNALSLLLGIQPDIECIGTYKNCVSLVEDLDKRVPDVVLMDIDMPQVNGIEGVKLIRHYFPDVLIIMQTVFEDDEKLFQSIQAGAHGYFLKNTGPDKLIEGIREVMAGGAPMTSSIASRVLMQFRNQSIAKSEEEEKFNLSAREIEVLNYLVKGYSHKMVANELAISTFTVNNHVRNIYRKLQVRSASEVVAFALKKGLVR